MKRGTIVLTPFPFTDLSGQKVRPALCDGEKYWWFSYHTPAEPDQIPRPHQVRDGAVFAELIPILNAQGYTDYGGLLLNYPP